ncbi:hypothetical protein PVAP13_3KG083127 [Panicum virgatum]|uniref:Uncharacterized protein n=1 Tax=Panicum virgatum TaxID=38727 RepID=A0A8T0UMN7_PANVG|nr:hypothetical protein PVAP13_3KG083127 [Panicum virgatum]
MNQSPTPPPPTPTRPAAAQHSQPPAPTLHGGRSQSQPPPARPPAKRQAPPHPHDIGEAETRRPTNQQRGDRSPCLCGRRQRQRLCLPGRAHVQDCSPQQALRQHRCSVVSRVGEHHWGLPACLPQPRAHNSLDGPIPNSASTPFLASPPSPAPSAPASPAEEEAHGRRRFSTKEFELCRVVSRVDDGLSVTMLHAYVVWVMETANDVSCLFIKLSHDLWIFLHMFDYWL